MSLQRLEDVYDLDNMTCEKHPGKKFPHLLIWLSLVLWTKFECPGPGIPRKKNSPKDGERV